MRSTYLWLLQVITGGLVAVFLGIHLVLLHVARNRVPGSEPSEWPSMLDRAVRGIWLGFYIPFLALVLYHGLYGLRGIILEMTPSPRMERLVTGAFIGLGAVALGLGIYVPVDLFVGKGS